MSKFITKKLIKPKRMGAVFVMSLISIIGITLGVSVLIVSYSIAKGFENEYHKTLLDFNAHIVILKYNEIDDAKKLIAQLNADEYRKKGLIGITPFIYREGLAVHKDRIKGIVIKGIDPKMMPSVSNMKVNFYAGQTTWEEGFEGTRGNTIVIGKSLAEDLHIDQDENILNILLPREKMEDVSNPDMYKPLKIIGTFESGLYDYDSQFALMTNKDVQKLFQIGGKVTGIEIKLDDPQKAHIFAEKFKMELPDDSYQITTWEELNSNLFKAIKFEKIAFSIIMGVMVLVAAFNIIGTIIIQIIDKKKQVAILQSLGLNLNRLTLIFLTQGLILGLIGSIFGLILGVIAIWGIGEFHLIPIDPQIYFLSNLPLAFSPVAYLLFTFAAIVVCGTTAWLSARRVANLSIVEGLGQSF